MNHNFFISIIYIGFVTNLLVISKRVRLRNSEFRKDLRLITFLSVMTLSLLIHWLAIESFVRFVPHFYVLIFFIDFLYGPLFYLYVAKTINSKPLFYKKIWYHFVPAGLQIILNSSLLLNTREELFSILVDYTNRMYLFDWGLGLLHTSLYLILTLALLNRTHKKHLNKFSLLHDFHLFYRLTGLIVILIIGEFFEFMILAFKLDFLHEFNQLHLTIPAVMIYLNYSAFSKSNYFIKTEPDTKYQGSSLSQSQIESIQKKLENLMVAERPYLNSKLSLDELAIKLDVNKKDLSRVINEKFNLNFFDYVNSYRLEDFKNRLKTNQIKTHTLSAIALDSGFNSKTTFNTVFKRLMKMTPSEYLKELDLKK